MGEKRVSRTAKLRKVFGDPPHRAKTPLRAGLYARISTRDQQPLLMQNSAVREYAAQRGWAIAMKFREVGSGWAARSPYEGTGGSTPPGDRRGARIIVFVPGVMGLAERLRNTAECSMCHAIGSEAVQSADSLSI